jgi:hypothetical protein
MLYTPRTPAFGVKLSQQLPYRMQSHPADASCISEMDSESILRCTQQKRLPMKKYTVKLLPVQTSKLQMRFKHAIVILRAASPKQAFIFRSLTRPLAIMKPPKKLLYVK